MVSFCFSYANLQNNNNRKQRTEYCIPQLIQKGPFSYKEEVVFSIHLFTLARVWSVSTSALATAQRRFELGVFTHQNPIVHNLSEVYHGTVISKGTTKLPFEIPSQRPIVLGRQNLDTYRHHHHQSPPQKPP